MFNTLFGAESEREADPAPVGDDKNPGSSDAEASTSSVVNPLLNLWSAAVTNTVKAVTNTVKARADELVKSVVDTDWRNELSQFSREVGEESKTLKDKTADFVEHLPEQVVHLPEKAEEALHHLPAQVHIPKEVGQTLEGVSLAFAQFGKTLLQGTRELIDELKDGVETEMAAASREGKRSARSKTAGASASKASAVQAKYSRFEAEVAAMQRDSSTYCDEPEDGEEYGRWRSGFSLEGVQPDIAKIMAENAFMAELHSRLVPIIVEHHDFWGRYFYRLHKLQQKEDQRQQLTQRAKTLQEDEVPLGWGDEDEAAPAPLAQEATAAPPAREAADDEAASAPAAEPALQSTLSAAQPEAASASVPEASEAPEAPTASLQEQPALTPKPSAASTSDEAADPKAGTAEPAPAEAVDADEATAGVSLPEPAAASAPLSELEDVAGSAQQGGDGASDGGGSGVSVSGGGASGGGVSGGGASSGGVSAGRTSTCEQVDGDGGNLESEPHAETASDSSALAHGEWCVVSSDAKATSPQCAATAAATGGESPRPQHGGPPSASGSPQCVPPPAAAEADGVSGASASVEAEPAEKPAKPATKGPGKGPSGPAPGKGGDDEEVDEDWGNWD